MKRKVLIVDDSGLARRSMRAILEAHEFEVVDAEDGMVALEKYFVERPDIVMLDLVMKGMYGLDVLTKLRELDPTVRVLVVSADVQSSSQDMVRAAGASGFITKPVQSEHLIATVRGILEGQG